MREAYPEQQKKNWVLSAFRSLLRRDATRLIHEERFLKKFYETYSAGFRYYPMLKEYLRAHFDVVVEKPGTKYLNIRCGEINSPDLQKYITSFKPDIIAVLGSSVLKQEMISLASVAMLNIHSGLSPYYRGTWSYGWPIVNREPEYIGVTIHHINAGIDTGDIVFQTKPVLKDDDDLNAIFLKVIAEGIELAVKAIEELSDRGRISSYQQPGNTGRLYQVKDFNCEAARACIRNLEEGILGEYLSRRQERDAKVKLYGYVPPVIFR